MNRTLLVRSAPLVILTALTVAGCGGGGGGGGAPTTATVTPGNPALPSSPTTTTPPPPPSTGQRVSPAGQTAAIRADLGGSSAASVSLQDQLVHVYRVPGVPGTSYRVSVDTRPSGRSIDLVVAPEGGGAALFSDTVQTPFTTTVTAADEVALELRVFDPFQAGLTLASLTVTPTAAPWDPGRFQVVIHVCGDSFANLGHSNNLATSGDLATFAGALIDRVNAILPADVQIDPTRSGIRRLSASQVNAVAPTLTPSGRTVLPLDSRQVSQLAQLGIPGSDPDFGRALDVFLVQDANPGFPDVTGQCECNDAGQGGVFVGTGPSHGVYLKLFERNGAGRTLAELSSTLAHELGHFLSMRHTTERCFSTDDIPDTPFSSPASSDLDGNAMLDPNESGPDASYVMFPYASTTKSLWSPGQRAAMRGYLSVREH